MSKFMEILLNLPHLLVLFWIIWTALTPMQVKYLFRKNSQAHRIPDSGELMDFRELSAAGCLAGFVLLTFITAYCTWLTLTLGKVI